MRNTIRQVINRVDELISNTYSDALKLAWINEVDGAIWNEVFKHTTSADVMRLKDTPNYALPTGVSFEHVLQVFVDGFCIPKIDYSMDKTTGFYRNSSGELCIYPVPTANDTVPGLRIVHLIPFTPHAISAIETDTVYAESPFDKIYLLYLSAMIDFNRREYNGYNNTLTLYNTAFEEYKTWLQQKKPIERGMAYATANG